jgi:hypothetical protein
VRIRRSNQCPLQDALLRAATGLDNDCREWARAVLNTPPVNAIVTIENHETLPVSNQYNRSATSRRAITPMKDLKILKFERRQLHLADRAIHCIEPLPRSQTKAFHGDALKSSLSRWVVGLAMSFERFVNTPP